MHQSSRRQFVFDVAAGTPMLLLAPSLQAQPSSSADPVLDAMIADMVELTREGNANPSARKGVLRAAESLTGAIAVHLGEHYDPKLKSNIKRLGKNRQAFVQDMVSKQNKPEITHEKVEAAIKALEKDGLQGVLLGTRKALKRVRDNAPEALLVKSTQWYGCDGLRWEMELIQMMMNLACALSLAFAGANAAADGACIVMGTLAAMMQGVLWWYGC